MRKITDFITDHCYAIFAVFLVLTGICAVLSTKVNINKNIYSYMPVDSETSMALDIMNDEFDYDQTSSYEMMLTNVPEDEKTNIKDFAASVDGVSSVEYGEGDRYNRGEYTRYIIADPPYPNPQYDFCAELAEHLKKNGYFVLSHPAVPFPPEFTGLELISDKKYAAAHIKIYRKK